MTKFFSIVLGVLLCTGVPALDVVIDGKPMAEIIIAADADEGVKRAAEDLQYHLKLISGAELKIISQPSAGVKNQLFVGESDFTRKLGYRLPAFKNSGYDIVVKDNYAVLAGPSVMSKPSPYVMTASDYRYAIARTIPRPADYPSPGLKAWQDFCGEKFTTIHVTNGGGNFNSPLKIFTNDDIGAWHAVSALLEQLGVRFYAPYENGAIVPEKKTIVLADQHLTREAKFARREFEYSNAKRTDKDGIAWLKRLKGGNYTRIIFNHTTCAIYVSPEQHQLHPEYLAEESPGKLWEGFSGSGKPR